MSKESIFYSQYENTKRIEEIIAKGHHRNIVGGLWDVVGNLQVEFMKKMGLKPYHKLLDIGCCCLRGGIKFLDYLEPNHYYGIDAVKKLIDVGYTIELAKTGLSHKLKRKNLFCSKLFKHERLPLRSIDYGIAVSVFTHLPFNYLRICLENIAQYFKPGGKFYVSFFEIPESERFGQPFLNDKDIRTVGYKDPYHYYRRDMIYAAVGTKWKANYIGQWNHPRGQMMIEYILTGS